MAVGDGTDVATASMEEKIHDHARGGRGEGGERRRERDEREGEWGWKGTRKVRRWPPA